MEDRSQVVLDQIRTILIFLARPAVLRQLVAFVVVTSAMWWLSKKLWPWLVRQSLAWLDRHLGEEGEQYWRRFIDEKEAQYIQRGLAMIERNGFPLLSIYFLGLAQRLFDVRGWHAGLLAESVRLFWVLFAYSVATTLLSMVLGERYVRRYRHRLLVPLWVLIIVGRLLAILIDTDALYGIYLLPVFGNPIMLGPLYTTIVVLYFLFTVAGAAQNIVQDFVVPRIDADPGVVQASLTIGRYVIIALGTLYALGRLGVEPSTLAFISGGLSVGIGFGLQQIFANFISGILLLFEQSLRPGDIVSVDGEMGVVEKLSIRSTTIRTLDDVDIIVPNSSLLTSSVRTYTKSSRSIRVLLKVMASPENDPRFVRDVLLQVARQHSEVQSDPEPEVFTDLDKTFQLAVWVEKPLHISRVTSELNLMILDEFAKRDIRI